MREAANKVGLQRLSDLQAKLDARAAARVVAEPTPQVLGEGIVALLEGRGRPRAYAELRPGARRRQISLGVEKRSLLAAYASLAPRRAR